MKNEFADTIWNRMRNNHSIFAYLCVGITGTLLFWPLLNSIFSILLFMYWMFFMNKEFLLKEKRFQLVCLFVAMYVLVIIGTLYSANMKEALFKLQQKSPFIVFPVVFGCVVSLQPLKYKLNVLLSFVVFTLAGCLVCLVNGLLGVLHTGSFSSLHGYDMVILKDTSPFILGLYCFLSIACLLSFLQQQDIAISRYKKWFVPAIIFLSVFLLLLGNRNILICWCLVVLYYCYRISGKLSTVFFIAGGLIAVLAVAVIVNPSLRRQWNDAIDFSSQNNIQLDTDQSLGRGWGGKTIRLTIWKCSWDIIKKNWLTGVGTGDVQDELQVAYENRKFYFASRYNRYNAHNQYIQETIAYGITGLIVFIACLTVPLYRFFRQPQHLLYCIFLLALIGICFTESVLELNKGIVFYSFFNSLFAFTKK